MENNSNETTGPVDIYHVPDFDAASHVIIDLRGEIHDDGDLMIEAETDCGLYEAAFYVLQDDLQRAADVIHARNIASWENCARAYAREAFCVKHLRSKHVAAYEKGYVRALHDCGEFEHFARQRAVESFLDVLKQKYVKTEEVA